MEQSQAYTIPFGQGRSLNALQAASVYSTIRGGGERVRPTMVRGSKGPDGRFTPAATPPRTRVISERQPSSSPPCWSRWSTTGGTGTKAKIPGYRAAR
ncbi:hypothetical protein GCM10020221_19390 [Streptomyces thioluteus]|uniref:Penicillin-binding protein transpeptidase domain-containing protein n=2 Tax=Streptomyces thioluteus TaxID=66431 RepID=A0ABN3WPQ9_STRTU